MAGDAEEQLFFTKTSDLECWKQKNVFFKFVENFESCFCLRNIVSFFKKAISPRIPPSFPSPLPTLFDLAASHASQTKSHLAFRAMTSKFSTKQCLAYILCF